MKVKGQHSCKTPEHGTPARIVELARAVIGSFGIDPASNAKWNRVVGAERFLDKRANGTKTPWVRGARDAEMEERHDAARLIRRQLRQVLDACAITAFVNPPGDPKGVLVAAFWAALAAYFDLGYLRSAIWVGFSLEQLARLQRVGAASHPLEHVTLVPEWRLQYSSKPGVAAGAPTHGSFVTLLTRDHAEVQRFRRLGAELGHVIVGSRW